MLAPLPALVSFTLDSGSYLSVSGTRVNLNAFIAPPGSMSSQHAVGGRIASGNICFSGCAADASAGVVVTAFKSARSDCDNGGNAFHSASRPRRRAEGEASGLVGASPARRRRKGRRLTFRRLAGVVFSMTNIYASPQGAEAAPGGWERESPVLSAGTGLYTGCWIPLSENASRRRSRCSPLTAPAHGSRTPWRAC